MAKATTHPDHFLISSEDVQGTDVYGVGDDVVGRFAEGLRARPLEARADRGAKVIWFLTDRLENRRQKAPLARP
jgi:hypothetical protein